MTDWQDFFDRFGYQHNAFAVPDLEDISIERLYQAFKARLMHECSVRDWKQGWDK